MDHGDAPVKQARQVLRQRLVAEREAMPAGERARRSARIERGLEALLARLAPSVIGFCWPIRGEFDARTLVSRFIKSGARAALPVLSAPSMPMAFREWQPGAPMTEDRLGIHIPARGALLTPDVLLMPLIGFDAAGYRLGYGGGYFDRTLAAAQPRPLSIGVGFELSRLASVDPQPWDVPCDFVVTEDGAWERRGGKLAPLSRA